MIEPEYITEEARRAAKHTYEDVRDTVHRNLGSSLFATLLTGFATGLFLGIVWNESRRKNRALQLLDDIEDRFKELTGSSMRRAGSLASDGLQSLNKGFHQGEARLEETFRKLRNRIGSFFS